MGYITARAAAAGFGGRRGDQGGKDKGQDGNQFFHRVEFRFANFDAGTPGLFDALQKIFEITRDSNLRMPFPSHPSDAGRMLPANPTRP